MALVTSRPSKAEPLGIIIQARRLIFRPLQKGYPGCLLRSREYSRREGQKDGAIADYTKANEINPMFAVAYRDRGRSLRD